MPSEYIWNFHNLFWHKSLNDQLVDWHSFLCITTGDSDRCTEEKQPLNLLNTARLLKNIQAFQFDWMHFKTSSNSPDSLGKTSCTIRVQQLNEQISEHPPLSPNSLLPSMYQMGRHLHAWGLKGKHIEGETQPRSLLTDMGQLYFRHQSDFLISGHVQGQTYGERKSGGGLQTLLGLTVRSPMLYSAHSPGWDWS